LGVAEGEQDGERKRKKEGALMTASSRNQTQELASRESDGLSVILLWHPRNDAVTVSVVDSRTGDSFQLAVQPERALDAFYHPFAYAA
jgi:hypothetical protein